MEKLADVLKIFIEKHLIPTMVSVVGTIITLLLFSEDNWIIIKIGKVLFIILTFCVYFLIIQFFFQIKKTIGKLASNINESNYLNEQNKKENKEAIRQINEFVDKLLPEDKDILISFIKNGNKILIAYDRMGGGLLENYNILNMSDYRGDVSVINRTQYWITPNLEQILNSGMRPAGGLKQYKIKDDLFYSLNQAYKINGKLGNF